MRGKKVRLEACGLGLVTPKAERIDNVAVMLNARLVSPISNDALYAQHEQSERVKHSISTTLILCVMLVVV